MRLGLGNEAAVLCGLALLVGGGYWQGQEAGRWQPRADRQAVDFNAISRAPDGWTSTDFSLGQKETNVAGIDAYLARRYLHTESGEEVTVLILSGKGGPISVHPPEVCFSGQGYKNEAKIVQVSLPGSAGTNDHQFDLAVFRGSDSTDGHRIQLLWGWTTSGIWSVPANPRLAFARSPRLYKMYVSRSLQTNHDRQDAALCLDLMQQLIPEMERALSDSHSAARASAMTEIVSETSPLLVRDSEFSPQRAAGKTVVPMTADPSVTFGGCLKRTFVHKPGRLNRQRLFLCQPWS